MNNQCLLIALWSQKIKVFYSVASNHGCNVDHWMARIFMDSKSICMLDSNGVEEGCTIAEEIVVTLFNARMNK